MTGNHLFLQIDYNDYIFRENDVQADTTFVITERYYQLIIKTVSSRFVEKTRSPSSSSSASRALISLEVYNN